MFKAQREVLEKIRGVLARGEKLVIDMMPRRGKSIAPTIIRGTGDNKPTQVWIDEATWPHTEEFSKWLADGLSAKVYSNEYSGKADDNKQ